MPLNLAGATKIGQARQASLFLGPILRLLTLSQQKHMAQPPRYGDIIIPFSLHRKGP